MKSIIEREFNNPFGNNITIISINPGSDTSISYLKEEVIVSISINSSIVYHKDNDPNITKLLPIIDIKNEDLESKPPFPILDERDNLVIVDVDYSLIDEAPEGSKTHKKAAVLVKPDGTERPFIIYNEDVDQSTWQSLINDLEDEYDGVFTSNGPDGFLDGSNFNHQNVESYITDLVDDGRINGSNLNNDLDSGAICFLGHVLVETDQGKIQIKDITSKNTIDGNEIVGVVKVKNEDNHMILFKKDSLGVNIPSEDTYVSRYHSILIKDEYIMAERLINNKNIIKEVRGHEIIYNVLLKKYYKMVINNMTVETLHPDNKLAQKYLKNI